MRPRFLGAALTVCLAMTCAGASFAQESDKAAADLFLKGRALLEKGDPESVEAACTMFEDSRKLDPQAIGTLFNLALCNEQRGRLATAWNQHSQVVAASRATRPDRVALSEARMRALEPRFTNLTVVVPRESEIPFLTIAIDQAERPRSALSAPFAIDGGDHVVTASAKGYATYTMRVTAPVERGALVVTIPRLERLPDQPAPTTPAPATGGPAREIPSETASPRTLGWVATAAGVAVMAVGAGFGISVLAQVKDTKAPVGSETPDQLEHRTNRYNELDTQAIISNIAIPVGALLAATGVYLVLTSKPAAQPAPVPSPTASGGPTMSAGPRDVRVGWQRTF